MKPRDTKTSSSSKRQRLVDKSTRSKRALDVESSNSGIQRYKEPVNEGELKTYINHLEADQGKPALVVNKINSELTRKKNLDSAAAASLKLA